MTVKNGDIQTISMVIKTSGLEFDDRLRKECISLFKLGYKVRVFSLVDSNRQEVNYPYTENIENCSFTMFSRKILKSHKFVALHIIEFGLRCFVKLFKHRTSVVWVHDPVCVFLLPYFLFLKRLGKIDAVIWDHHELLVEKAKKNKYFARFFASMARRCDHLIQANTSRKSSFCESFAVSDEKVTVINNFPDRAFFSELGNALPVALSEWLNSRRYILVQSGAVSHRNFSTIAEAMLVGQALLPVVFVGGFDRNLIEQWEERFPNEFKERFYFVGKVKQEEISTYLKPAALSIVLYKKDFSENNWLCEPNRLYQAISCCIPVIVGNNPVMKLSVEECHAGIVLSDDGNNPVELREAVEHFMKSSCEFYDVSNNVVSKFVWENQEHILGDVVQKALS